MELLAWGNTVMEPHLFRIAPEAGSGDPYTHEGEEFIYVLRGELAIAVESKEYRLKPGDSFVHESIIGSLFNGRVEAATTVGNQPAISPSIAGWARMTGLNTIFVDDRDPYAHGFEVR